MHIRSFDFFLNSTKNNNKGQSFGYQVFILRIGIVPFAFPYIQDLPPPTPRSKKRAYTNGTMCLWRQVPL